MRISIVGALLYSAISWVAFAVPITRFIDAETFIELAKDIIVAECISVPQQAVGAGQLRAVEVNVLKVLKGARELGRFRIATIHPMEPHTTYMLYNLGGDASGTDFLAVPELSVVPLPAAFKVDELKDEELKEQVQYLFSRRLFEVERELAPLLHEKGLLDKAVSDRQYEWYQADGPVVLGPIMEGRTRRAGTYQTWLDLGDERLQWSQSSPGRSGFLYFEKMDTAWTPYWEFSPCDATNIEDLAGKPLRARFYGMYTPGRDETALKWTGLQAIHVAVGQVLFVRTVDDPRKIYALRIVRQAHEAMSVRYALIRD